MGRARAVYFISENVTGPCWDWRMNICIGFFQFVLWFKYVFLYDQECRSPLLRLENAYLHFVQLVLRFKYVFVCYLLSGKQLHAGCGWGAPTPLL